MSLIGISGKKGVGKDTVARMIQGLDARFADHVIIDTLCSPDGYNWLTESDWEIKRFADKLKDIVCLLIGCTREQLEDREFKEKPLGKEWWYHRFYLDALMEEYIMIPYKGEKNEYQVKNKPDQYSGYTLVKLTPRKLMQLLGTDCGRDIIHPDIWVNALFADYEENTYYGDRLDKNGKFVDNSSKWIIPDMRFPNEANAVKERNGILIRVNRPIKKRQKGSSKVNAILHLKNTHPSETALDNYKNWDYIIDNNEGIPELVEKVKQICKKENII